MLTPIKKKTWRSVWGLSFVLAIYSLLLLPTLNRQGISWDEQVDIMVARAYLKSPNGWLYGSALDPSQTRLPAFTVALFYKLLHNTSLFLARVVSWVVGAFALIGVYVYCKRRFDTRRGIIASALLAASPFFLSFARVAFTETDIYLACTMIWLLVVTDRFQEYPSLARSSLVGIFWGLCISAKFTAVAIFPAVWFSVWQTKHHHLGGSVRGYRIRWLFVYILIPVIAVATFLITPPEHLLNHAILTSLTERIQHEMTYRVSFMLQAIALHGLSILFKSSLVIGAGMIFSLFLITYQSLKKPTDRWQIHFPLVVVWSYIGCLMVLPLAQTFYTIPLLPILAIFAADQFVSFYNRKRVYASVLAVIAVLTLIADLMLCYPDYNLNGYQWLGKRMLAGRPSIGYRSVVQTPSDGVEQVMNWLNVHAAPGEHVRAYLVSWHIAQEVAQYPSFILENGFQPSKSPDPEYVVTEINAQIRQIWWIQSPSSDKFVPLYDTNWLDANYVRVFSVKRAFGIEMASVYQKR